jgi:hypothetical protein
LHWSFGSLVASLGLAGLGARWLPDAPSISWVLILFAARSAAYLLVNEIRGYDDDTSS